MSNKRNPFEEMDNQPADVDTNGPVTGGLRASNPSVRIQQISINEIWADPTQSRRIAPSEARPSWDGSPKQVRNVLKKWREIAEKIHGGSLPVALMITGEAEIPSVSDKPEYMPLVKYLDLVGLAQNIYGNGQNDAITVRRVDDHYQIVYGERRWTAFHLIVSVQRFDSSQWLKMKCQVETLSAWEAKQKQASENAQRTAINAISKAREIASLIMAAIMEAEEGTFNSITAFDHEWDYYAQVADGNVHRIPRGMGGNISSAVNLSTGQIRNYRALLRMTDDAELNRKLWTLGDDRDWAEQFMREVNSNIDPETLWEWVGYGADEANMREMLSTQKELYRHYSDGIETPPQPSPQAGRELLQRGEDDFGTSYVNPNQPSYDGKKYSEEEKARIEAQRQKLASMGTPEHTQRQPKFKRLDWVIVDGLGLGQISAIHGLDKFEIVMNSDKRRLEAHVEYLSLATNLHSLPPHDIVGFQVPPDKTPPSPPASEGKYQVGMRVETQHYGFGEVVGFEDGKIQVLLDSKKHPVSFHPNAIAGIQTELPLDEGVEGNNDDSIAPVDLPLLIGAVDCMADMAFQLDVEGVDERMRELSRMLDKIQRGDLDVSLSGLSERFAVAVQLLEYTAGQFHSTWDVITKKIGGRDE